MSQPRDLTAFYLGSDGEVWRIAYYCDEPTITYVRVDDPTIKRGGAVGSPNVRDFRLLIPEGERRE